MLCKLKLPLLVNQTNNKTMALPILSLVLLLTWFLLEAPSSFSLQPLCHDEESSALLQLKSSFVISKHASDPHLAHPKTLSWKPHKDCCLWDGVECEAETGYVIGLDLSSSYLYGSITSNNSLFHLLHLGDNDFRFSPIPNQITQLTALTYLNLSHSVFHGQVPPGISNLANLVSIDFSRNLYNDKPLLQLERSTFTKLVHNLTNLKKLDLSFVYLPFPLPPQLANLSSVTHLLLYNCSLQGKFPSEIFHLPNLQVLIVAKNANLSGELPESLSSSSLNTLQLDLTSFSGSLPTSIGNIDSLTVISIGGCKFGGPIPSSLGNLTKLAYLDLGYNEFIGPIPSSLANLTKLAFLSFANNTLHHDNYAWLGSHPRLTTLKLFNTNMVSAFPSSVRNLTELTWLDLSENQLTGKIPSWLSNSTQLTVLNLGNNQLDGSIPRSITELYNMKSLDLVNNSLSGTLGVEIFSNMTNLEEIELGYNKLSFQATGSITNPKLTMLGLGACNLRGFPTFMKKLNALRLVDLCSNNINGAIPEWLWKANRNIQFLALAGNALTGQISSSICNLHALNILNVIDNNLSGPLPQCLGNSSSDLQVMNLRNNSFQGSIPWLFTQGNILRSIDLSHNQLNGRIPRSLLNCSLLEKLDLSNNQISDMFPSWLGYLTQLQILSLQSNKLYGKLGIPTTNFNFPALRIIDLSHNQLMGELPSDEFFDTWSSMRAVRNDLQTYMTIELNICYNDGKTYVAVVIIDLGIKGMYMEDMKTLKTMVAIDLSNNRFRGRIPNSIGGLQALVLLNFSNNQLSGAIPESLGNLTNIESIDLLKNMLSGQIPQQLAALSFLEVLDVSNNNLVGPIPQGTQFDGFPDSSFMGNLALCGCALRKPCSDQVGSPNSIDEDEDENEDGEEDGAIKWVLICLGYGSGIVVGAILGNIFFEKNEEWLTRHMKWNILGQRRL